MLFTGKSGKRHCPSGREKKACYDGIADALAAVGPTRRAASEVRHKKENWFSAVKKKVLRFGLVSQLWVVLCDDVQDESSDLAWSLNCG